MCYLHYNLFFDVLKNDFAIATEVHPVLRRIFQYPLTIVRFLCYPIHGELLCGGWFGGTAILPHEFSFSLFSCYLCIIAQQILQLQQKCKILLEFFCENGQGISAVVNPVTISLNVPPKSSWKAYLSSLPTHDVHNLQLVYSISDKQV